jgi:thymidine kinase
LEFFVNNHAQKIARVIDCREGNDATSKVITYDLPTQIEDFLNVDDFLLFGDQFSKEHRVQNETNVDDREAITYPTIMGFKGPMFSEKTRSLVVLSKTLMKLGFKVLVISPGIDVRHKSETARLLARIENIHSGFNVVGVDGWKIDESKLNAILNTETTDDVPKVDVGYMFVQSRSQDRVLGLAVSNITEKFMDIIMSDRDTFLFTNSGEPYVPDVVVLDECQFLNEEETNIFLDRVFFKNRKYIIVGGLISDFKQDHWGNYYKFATYMSFDILCKSKCIDCEEMSATYTRKYNTKSIMSKYTSMVENGVKNSDAIIQIGDGDVYYSICQRCLWREVDRDGAHREDVRK